MHHVLINTAKNFTFSSDCGSERNLSGSYLIEYENCTLLINNVSYISKSRNITGKPLHLPLDGISITKNGDILNLSMEHLHELQMETRKDLEYLQLDNNSLHFPHWSIFGGITVLPIIIGIAILCSILFNRSTKIKLQTNIPKPTPDIKDRGKTETKNNIDNFRKLTIADIMPLEDHH